MGKVKLNIDGARDKHGNASCGGWEDEGEWISGISKYIGICDSYT